MKFISAVLKAFGESAVIYVTNRGSIMKIITVWFAGITQIQIDLRRTACSITISDCESESCTCITALLSI